MEVFYADSDAINRFEKFLHHEVVFPSIKSELILSIILFRQSPAENFGIFFLDIPQ